MKRRVSKFAGGDGDRRHCQLLSHIELLCQPFLFYPLRPLYGAVLITQEDNFWAVSFKVQTFHFSFQRRSYNLIGHYIFTLVRTFLCVIDHDVSRDILHQYRHNA